jgi:hypothetical protein
MKFASIDCDHVVVLPSSRCRPLPAAALTGIYEDEVARVTAAFKYFSVLASCAANHRLSALSGKAADGRIFIVRNIRPDDLERNFEIWMTVVAMTHRFLSKENFLQICDLVRDRYLPTADLSFVEVAISTNRLTAPSLSDRELTNPRNHSPRCYGRACGFRG